MGIPLVPIEKAIKLHEYVEECRAKKQADSSGNFFQAIRGIEDSLKTNIGFQRKLLKETENFRGRRLKDEFNENDELDSDEDFNETKSQTSEGKKKNKVEKRPGYNRLKQFEKQWKNGYHMSTGTDLLDTTFMTDKNAF